MAIPHKNIIASFSGQVWMAFISIAFIPLYIKHMGIEAYGLVGFFTTIQSLFVIVDMGLTTSMSREIARLIHVKDSESEIFGTSRTIEYLYWFMAVCFGLGVIIAAPLIATKWLNVEQLTPDNARYAIVLMGISIMFQLPTSVYAGGLMGLQRQVTLNKIYSAMATLRAIGALLVLMLFENKTIAFFSWQIIASALQTFLISYYFKRLLPQTTCHDIKFRDTFAKIWRFTAGVSATTFMALIFMQVDKIVISKFFTLKQFAYYSLASSLAATIYKAVVPITSVMMPRFTELIALNDIKELIKTYHHACLLVSFSIMPAVAVGVMFSREILLLWTNDVLVSNNAYIILSLLLTGTMLNALYHIPYNLQLAYGWNKLGVYSTTISALLVAPASIISVMRYGLVGPATVWLVFNLCYILLVIPIMHKKVLKNEGKIWYLHDIFMPLLSSFLIALLWRVLSRLSVFKIVIGTGQPQFNLVLILLALLTSYAGTAYIATPIRNSIIGFFSTKTRL